jgi:hypothetical protein
LVQALTEVERGIFNLTIKCVRRVRSQVLARVILKIVSKVLKTLRSKFLVKDEMLGSELAKGTADSLRSGEIPKLQAGSTISAL